MRKNLTFATLIGVLAIGMAASGAPQGGQVLVAGGTEVALAPWTPGEGNIEPGGRIRGWSTTLRDVLIGPAGELATAEGPVTMSCNLDESVTGPCWGRFTLTNATGSWEGTWIGTFNFVTGAGVCRVYGHGTGGLFGLTIENDVVYPGRAVNEAGGAYVYSTVRTVRRH